LPDITVSQLEDRAVFIAENDGDSVADVEPEKKDDYTSDAEFRDTGGASCASITIW
jgi:hypothetical protein